MERAADSAGDLPDNSEVAEDCITTGNIYVGDNIVAKSENSTGTLNWDEEGLTKAGVTVSAEHLTALLMQSLEQVE